ncbi:MAG TPA: adenosine deaminase [Microbacterium sp.]|uniref:adenosine deaminase n=1 Tax=Microbacterium sp. UBA1097 TaxID=1946941 RepID=UPI000E8775AE|nr:adenosine deaminase [Microbacterium sp. UBA1097]HBS08160.1 adenosine deaminase [Microbacterium sp.]HBU42825.1 adenosine deaminase [Microbacterium sp.]|tara:strand:- start:2557 stop:3570 length:1014 start_codon:yes stop_codon:yes gene_type:complete
MAAGAPLLINLHSHLEGRVRPSTAAEIARELGMPDADRDWEAALQLDRPADLTTYLVKVVATFPFFARLDLLERITREAVEDAAADGEDHLELRFGPASHASTLAELDAVIAAMCGGIAAGIADTGISAGVVVAALRSDSTEVNEAVARAAARAAGTGVVGFDLAGDEMLFPGLARYRDAFAIARSAGLGITCHAAEAASGRAAQQAVELLGATRIGHGARIAEEPDLIGWFIERDIAIEVCPTSNVYTGAVSAMTSHPAARFARAGARVVLGDDNPRQTGSLLSNEVAVLRGDLGFDDAMIEALAHHSVDAAFVPDGVRRSWRNRLETTPEHGAQA